MDKAMDLSKWTEGYAFIKKEEPKKEPFDASKFLPPRDLLRKEQVISVALRRRWPKWMHVHAIDTELQAVIHAKYCQVFCRGGHIVFPDGEQCHGNYRGSFLQLRKDFEPVQKSLAIVPDAGVPPLHPYGEESPDHHKKKNSIAGKFKESRAKHTRLQMFQRKLFDDGDEDEEAASALLLKKEGAYGSWVGCDQGHAARDALVGATHPGTLVANAFSHHPERLLTAEGKPELPELNWLPLPLQRVPPSVQPPAPWPLSLDSNPFPPYPGDKEVEDLEKKPWKMLKLRINTVVSSDFQNADAIYEEDDAAPGTAGYFLSKGGALDSLPQLPPKHMPVPPAPPPVGYLAGHRPLFLLDCSKTMKVHNRLADMKQCLSELLAPNGQVDMYTSHFGVVLINDSYTESLLGGSMHPSSRSNCAATLAAINSATAFGPPTLLDSLGRLCTLARSEGADVVYLVTSGDMEGAFTRGEQRRQQDEVNRQNAVASMGGVPVHTIAIHPTSASPVLKELAEMSCGGYVELFNAFNDISRPMSQQVVWKHGAVHGRAIPPVSKPKTKLGDPSLQHLFQAQMQLQARMKWTLFENEAEAAASMAELALLAAAPNNAVLALEMQAALTWSEEKLTTLRRTCLLRKEFKPVPELLAQLRSHYLSDVYEPKAAVARAFLAKSEKAKVATKRLEDSGPQIVANSNVDKQIETHRLRNKMARLKDAERETGASGANDKAPQVKPLDAKMKRWAAVIEKVRQKMISGLPNVDLTVHFLTADQKAEKRKRKWERLRREHEKEVDAATATHHDELDLVCSAYRALRGKPVSTRRKSRTAEEKELEAMQGKLRVELAHLHSNAMHRCKGVDEELTVAAEHAMHLVVQELKHDRSGRYDYGLDLWSGLLAEWRRSIENVQRKYMSDCEERLKEVVDKHERHRMDLTASNNEAKKVYNWLRDSFTHECVKAALQARVTAWRHQLKQAEGITNISFPNLVWTKYSKDIIGIFRGVIHQPEVVLEAWAMYGRAVAYAAELGLTANEAKDLPIRVLERELKEFPIKALDPWRHKVRAPPSGLDKFFTEEQKLALHRFSQTQQLEQLRRKARENTGTTSLLDMDDGDEDSEDVSNVLMAAYKAECAQWEIKRTRKIQAEEELISRLDRLQRTSKLHSAECVPMPIITSCLDAAYGADKMALLTREMGAPHCEPAGWRLMYSGKVGGLRGEVWDRSQLKQQAQESLAFTRKNFVIRGLMDPAAVPEPAPRDMHFSRWPKNRIPRHVKEQERGSKEGGRRSRTTGNDVYVRRALEAKALAQKQQQEEAEEAGRVKSEETTHRAKKMWTAAAVDALGGTSKSLSPRGHRPPNSPLGPSTFGQTTGMRSQRFANTLKRYGLDGSSGMRYASEDEYEWQSDEDTAKPHRLFGSPARPDYVPRHIPTSIYMDPAFEAEGHELTPEITEALIKQAVLEKDKERIETERAEARALAQKRLDARRKSRKRRKHRSRTRRSPSPTRQKLRPQSSFLSERDEVASTAASSVAEGEGSPRESFDSEEEGERDEEDGAHSGANEEATAEASWDSGTEAVGIDAPAAKASPAETPVNDSGRGDERAPRGDERAPRGNEGAPQPETSPSVADVTPAATDPEPAPASHGSSPTPADALAQLSSSAVDEDSSWHLETPTPAASAPISAASKKQVALRHRARSPLKRPADPHVNAVLDQATEKGWDKRYPPHMQALASAPSASLNFPAAKLSPRLSTPPGDAEDSRGVQQASPGSPKMETGGRDKPRSRSPSPKRAPASTVTRNSSASPSRRSPYAQSLQPLSAGSADVADDVIVHTPTGVVPTRRQVELLRRTPTAPTPHAHLLASRSSSRAGASPSLKRASSVATGPGGWARSPSPPSQASSSPSWQPLQGGHAGGSQLRRERVGAPSSREHGPRQPPPSPALREGLPPARPSSVLAIASRAISPPALDLRPASALGFDPDSQPPDPPVRRIFSSRSGRRTGYAREAQEAVYWKYNRRNMLPLAAVPPEIPVVASTCLGMANTPVFPPRATGTSPSSPPTSSRASARVRSRASSSRPMQRPASTPTHASHARRRPSTGSPGILNAVLLRNASQNAELAPPVHVSARVLGDSSEGSNAGSSAPPGPSSSRFHPTPTSGGGGGNLRRGTRHASARAPRRGATADESPSRTTSASSQRSKSSSTCKGKPKLSRRAQSANALSKSQLDTWRASDTGVFAEPSTIHENPNELVSGDAEEGGAFVVAEEETPDMQVATTAQLKTRIASSRTTSALARPRSPPVPIGRRKPALVEGPATSSSRPHTARVSRLSGTKVAGELPHGRRPGSAAVLEDASSPDGEAGEAEEWDHASMWVRSLRRGEGGPLARGASPRRRLSPPRAHHATRAASARAQVLSYSTAPTAPSNSRPTSSASSTSAFLDHDSARRSGAESTRPSAGMHEEVFIPSRGTPSGWNPAVKGTVASGNQMETSPEAAIDEDDSKLTLAKLAYTFSVVGTIRAKSGRQRPESGNRLQFIKRP